VLDFITHGGDALRAYPEYRKVVVQDGRYVVTSRMVAMRHRLSIGTIVSESAMKVQFVRGRTLGSVEENFIARLRPGDHFTFAGRTLEFVRVRGMVAYVRKSSRPTSVVPHWSGARMPISPELAASVRERLDEARRGIYHGPEMAAVRAILEIQAAWSRLPAADELLVERVATREGTTCSSIRSKAAWCTRGSRPVRLPHRAARAHLVHPRGQRLRSRAPFGRARAHPRGDRGGPLLPAHLLHDIPASLNAAELARRQFREIARVAGLIFQGYPGVNKSVKQVQASSELLYDVFARYDPHNLLLFQAHREVLERSSSRAGWAGRWSALRAGACRWWTSSDPPRSRSRCWWIVRASK
jgi:Lhr-like helicases